MSKLNDNDRDNLSLRCSFCGKNQYEVEKLVAGPSAFVCNECIAKLAYVRSDDELARVEANSGTRIETEADPSVTQQYCAFCGKSQHEVIRLFPGPSVSICTECVLLTFDIINDEIGHI